jgi:hypothetical protein
MGGGGLPMDCTDFDEIVTGRLTHLTIWLEEELIGLITDYLLGGVGTRKDSFKRLIMYRDGLTMQDKLEIYRAIVSELNLSDLQKAEITRTLNEVIEFKSYRNALAHGRENSRRDDRLEVVIEIVTRSGKFKEVTLTEDGFEKLVDTGDRLLEELRKFRSSLKL